MHTKTQQARHASYRCRGRDNEQIAYNELMVVHFGAGEQREREAREEAEHPGRRRRRHGERRALCFGVRAALAGTRDRAARPVAFG